VHDPRNVVVDHEALEVRTISDIGVEVRPRLAQHLVRSRDIYVSERVSESRVIYQHVGGAFVVPVAMTFETPYLARSKPHSSVPICPAAPVTRIRGGLGVAGVDESDRICVTSAGVSARDDMIRYDISERERERET